MIMINKIIQDSIYVLVTAFREVRQEIKLPFS